MQWKYLEIFHWSFLRVTKDNNDISFGNMREYNAQ